MNKQKIGILATKLLTGFILASYILLEIYFFNDLGCSCTVVYYSSLTSRIIGYVLLIISAVLFTASVWKIKNLSRLWTIPALFVFGIAFYGKDIHYILSIVLLALEKLLFLFIKPMLEILP